MLIKTKKEFYQLAREGRCGNTPKTWNSIAEFWPERSKYLVVGIRRTVAAHKILTPGISSQDIALYLDSNGIEEGTYIITVVPPHETDHLCTLQGELTWLHGTWYLYYTHRGGYMRRALVDDPNHAYGWKVLELLRKFCTPADYEDLTEHLFNQYTEDMNYPVIEFSVLFSNAGRIQGRNTLIWEIRHY